MARRRMTVDDDVEILVHWRAGRGIRQIARSLGCARNTVRERIAQAEAAGFAREGPPRSAAEWRAALSTTAAEGGAEARFPVRASLGPLHEEIAEALRASTMTTVWGRLFGQPGHDIGAVRKAYGTVPVAGFFAAGEFGPVGQRNFLHGFTASMLVVRRGREQE